MPSKGSSYTFNCCVPGRGYFGAASLLAFPLFHIMFHWRFFRRPFCFRHPRARNLVMIFSNFVHWCNWKGEKPRVAGPNPSPYMVSKGIAHATPQDVIFRDPSSFVAGELSRHKSYWKFILSEHPKKDEILSYIVRGSTFPIFASPSKATSRGNFIILLLNQRRFFPNSKSCPDFEEFISSTILDRAKNDSPLVWGNVGSVQPPHLVLPITVEPTKPRMCHDERFLNLWIKDLPLSLDYIFDLPRYAFKSHFQTNFDDNSGYDHVKLPPNSFTFVGLEWKGWYFCFKTLPFGWKASAYVYHTVGLAATCHIRSLAVPCSQGKVTSFSLAVPAAQLYAREVNRAISLANRSSRPIKVVGDLRSAIAHSRFLDSWSEHLSWMDERHLVVNVTSDASQYAWGGVVHNPSGPPLETLDIWSEDVRDKPIAVKEALALVNTLKAGKSVLSNCRVDAHVDCLALIQASERGLNKR